MLESGTRLGNALSGYWSAPENTACEKSHPRHLPALMPPTTKLLFFMHNFFFSRCIFTCFGLKLYTPRRVRRQKWKRLSRSGPLFRSRHRATPDYSGATETDIPAATAASSTKIKVLLRFSERIISVNTNAT